MDVRRKQKPQFALLCCLLATPYILAARTNSSGPLQIGDEKSECDRKNVPTSLAWDSPSIRVEENHIRFEQLGQSAHTLVVRSLELKPIAAIALVVEYIGTGEAIVDEVPLRAGTTEALNTFRAPFAVQGGVVAVSDVPGVSQWEQPVSPGSLVLIGGVKDGIRTSVCPARASITCMMVQFSDGSSRTYTSPGWKVGPLPQSIPRVSNSVPISISLPTSLGAKIKINAAGEILEMVVPPDRDQSVLFEWVRNYMKHSWKFYPALVDGKPVNSELPVLFCFHAHVTPDVFEREPTSTPVTMIHFYPRRELYPTDDSPQQFAVAYGELGEDSSLNDPR